MDNTSKLNLIFALAGIAVLTPALQAQKTGRPGFTFPTAVQWGQAGDIPGFASASA